ncbi:type III restriction enzyme [Allochromatium warmingii]|uniref:Type III restriction enzyme n=1 Tax=Allochromatium warmingii TaxID=61595 RepID=A0A1H3C133_ALLWA|nr:DEAD/DEAH box helicase family protein [Allochromatium warmingii]SDX47800.1 type III restriction enzyme [Allochromatium warmingii]
MTTFAPKTYQSDLLTSVELYFRTCHALGSPALAYTATTEQLWGRGNPYHSLPGFPPDMPYFCLRVPTGGGKTWLAAASVARVNTQLLRTDHSLILWLVPSKSIRTQTLRALQNRHHPYHSALRDAGPVSVLALDDARALTRATLDSSTTVIVATRQAFQVEDAECRKVYQSSGDLMHHFDALSPIQRAALLTDGDGSDRITPYSLANVFRLRRPFVIVDEAHNSRTDLAFEMLARLRPSGILELTATPDLHRTPSNVLHSVSALELKNESMIKLPVMLEIEPHWQHCIANALARRDALQQLADAETQAGAPYLRPIVLIQAEPRRSGVETLDVERVKQELITNQGLPAEAVVIATGDERGLEQLDADYQHGINDPRCPVTVVITQKALAEGWDCPFAYILVSLASLSSSTAVEQLLGRILRQPNACRRQAPELNQSYAFVVSHNFAETAQALRDRLVSGAGFERREVRELVAAVQPEPAWLDLSGQPNRVIVHPVTVTLTETPDLKAVPKPVRDKLDWDQVHHTLTIRAPLSADETAQLTATVTSVTAINILTEAAAASRTTAIELFQTPAERGVRFRVPQLAIPVQGRLCLFDDPSLLGERWELPLTAAAPTADDLQQLDRAMQYAQGGRLDIDATSGTVKMEFLADLQRDLDLIQRAESWDSVRLATWLCRNLPEASLIHGHKRAFVATWLTALLAHDGFTLARATLQRYQIRDRLEAQVRYLRRTAAETAYQQALFSDASATPLTVSDDFSFEFQRQHYAPPHDYDPATSVYGHFDFRGHYYPRIGDFDSREEFECACQLDILTQQGRLAFWVRNLVRTERRAFYLQKADGRFYPDFLCQLPASNTDPGPVLAVEYKGADRWDTAAPDRLIGELWANLSAGRCRFVMVRDKRWDWIEAQL